MSKAISLKQTAAPRSDRPAYVVLASLFLIVMCVVSFLHVYEFDIFWHMSVGREIIQRGQISFPNIFDSTTNGRVYENIEWLFELAAYGLAALEPEKLTWVSAFLLFFLAGIYAVLWRLAFRFGASPAAAAILLAWSFSTMDTRLYIRPFMVTYLCYAIFVYMLCANFDREKFDKRLLWMLPAVMVIWVNCHPLCFNGLLIIGMAWLAELIKAISEKDGFARVKNMTLTGVLTFAASFVHPHPGKYIARIWYALFEYTKLVAVDEEKRLPFSSNRDFYILLLIGILLVPIAVKRKKWFHLFLFAFAGLFAWRNARFVGDFAVLAMPYFLALASARPLADFANKLSRPLIAVPVGAAAILGVFLNIHYSGRFIWGPGIDCTCLPCGAVRFIEENYRDRPIYNNLGFGGYIIWKGYPRIKPFWDGRFEAQKHLFYAVPRLGFPKFLVDHGFYLALLPNSAENASSPILSIEREILEAADSWAPVYFDQRSILMAHPCPQTEQLMREHAFGRLRPWRMDLGLSKSPSEQEISEARAEAMRALQASPDDTFCLWLAANVNWKAGNKNDADRLCRKCIDEKIKTGNCLALMGLMELSAKRPASALEYLKKARSKGMTAPFTLNNLAIAHLENGNPYRALWYLKEALEKDPDNKMLLRNISIVYEKLGKQDQSQKYILRAQEGGK